MDWQKLLSKRRIKKSSPHDIRNQFESDYGRIIYSPALRRMHDKTQVFPLTTDDNIHSRLTHSNEVMSLGYTFGLKLSRSKIIQKKTALKELDLIRILPILLQNVCLIHDIGNAPFGHFGETIVSDYFKELDKTHKQFKGLTDRQKLDFFNYDGNAQGLRVLTKLQYLDNPFGLNLTFATLASYLKYPNHQEINDNLKKELKKQGKVLESKEIERAKHGVFISEEPYFDLIVKECGLKKNGRVLRHPICYLMEAADSIAYLCMDMEDGFNKGLLDIQYLDNSFSSNSSEIAKKIVEICKDGTMSSTPKMVSIRIALIGYLVGLAFDNFEKNIDLIEKGKYNQELIKDDPSEIFEILQKCSYQKIFTSRDINYLESTGHSVFTGLLDFYVQFLFHENDKYIKRAKRLISRSTIDAAIEENLLDLCSQKLGKELQALTNDKKVYKSDSKETQKVDEKIRIASDRKDKFEGLQKKYSKLFNRQIAKELSKDEQRELRVIKNEIYSLIKPDFDDLSDYFKFRVILDFISGMTDQFALSHYQKLSGQKIT
jgi:dGTPase